MACTRGPIYRHVFDAGSHLPVGRTRRRAWLDPSLITDERLVYMDMNLDRGAGYGDTLTWSERGRPALEMQLVHAQMNVDMPKFAAAFVRLMTSPTPRARDH